MCIATPEEILSVEETITGPVGVICHAGKNISVDLSLVPEAKVGDTILYFRGNAVRLIGKEEAEKIRSALGALADVMDGKATEGDIEAGFADLIAHPAELPEHLKAQLEKQNASRKD